MPDTVIVASFPVLLQEFASCFTAPSFRTFVVLASGWLLAMGRHTVTGVVRAANAVGWKHIGSFHRFFSRARWATDAVCLVLARLVEARLAKGAPLTVVLDDTLGRHTGKSIAGASMHRDPMLSTALRPLFHWGHLWVVLGITVRAFGKTWCLPVLFRLYRGKQRCKTENRVHRTCPQLGAELLEVLAKALPHRRIVVVVDAAYSNHAVIKTLPENVTLVGRCRLDAAIYEPPPPRRPGQIGRPRVRGAKLPSPQSQAAAHRAPWRSVDAILYGRKVTVRALVIDALWYVAAGSQLLRLVVVRGFPGHDYDDVFVCTEPRMGARQILEAISDRWSLEVTFHEAKGKLGFEDPQNRTELAVERTAPMALWIYSLVVLWYLQIGQCLPAARGANAPWYRQKTEPAFSDMLATLRRASWSERLLDPRAKHSTSRKALKPLLEYLEAVA